jgi:hypothetical protein
MLDPVEESQARFTVAAYAEDSIMVHRTKNSGNKTALFSICFAKQSFLSENGMLSSHRKGLKWKTLI